MLYNALMTKIRLYVKDGCWLCDQAEEVLNGLRQRYDLVIDKTDITLDDALYERFRFEIPVVELPDGEMLKGRLRKDELERWLDGHKK
jgi:hypothetical protein